MVDFTKDRDKRIFPKDKKIVIITTPTIYADRPLVYGCPNFFSLGILKMMTFLKKRGNQVSLIDMRSEDRYFWKFGRGGQEGNHKIKLKILGKDLNFLKENLNSIERPDEIWISSIFAYDYELVQKIIEKCRVKFPAAYIRAGGDFIRFCPELTKKIDADCFIERIAEADAMEPDFSILKEKLKYGVFQLTIGCANKCSFCTIGVDHPTKFNPRKVISYMKKFYSVHKPREFWCWDPNSLAFPKTLIEFLRLYIDSGMKSQLKFGKGFQPNLLTRDILKLMKEANLTRATIPIEGACSHTIKEYNKPYTIISTIKVLEMCRKLGYTMQEFNCTYVIGYPFDDMRSIFRSLLCVRHFGGRSSPFPVFISPLSTDFVKFKDIIKDKDISELHGQLWPLIESKKVKSYQKLFRFLISENEDLNLLDEDLRTIYLEEKDLCDRFITLCLEHEDTLKNLEKIESLL